MLGYDINVLTAQTIELTMPFPFYRTCKIRRAKSNGLGCYKEK